MRLFNRGRYLSANAVWERAWRASEPADRGFLEGLVQLAGSLHLRARRGATRGATHLLAQALVTLEDYRPDRHGVDVEALIADFAAYLDWLRAIDRPHRFADRSKIPRLLAR
jgi:predicted metal-dependent hydrolase